MSSASERTTIGVASHAAVELRGVGLRFRKYTDRLSPTLKGTLVNTALRRQARVEDYWIFEDLDLSIGTGERVGVIGSNGAGKTTLIKLIAGVYTPARGTVRVAGRVAPLVELSTGLNMELSGLENILLLGSLLGRSPAELTGMTAGILDFAGLHDFAATPMKYYSTGMISRLSFSIATTIDPEILLMDEVFAGGDADFVPKATARMHELMDASHIVVFVSHNLKLMRELTERVLWIDHGRVVRDGPTEDVCDEYAASRRKN